MIKGNKEKLSSLTICNWNFKIQTGIMKKMRGNKLQTWQEKSASDPVLRRNHAIESQIRRNGYESKGRIGVKKRISKAKEAWNIRPWVEKVSILSRRQRKQKQKTQRTWLTLATSSALMRTNSFLLWEPAMSRPLVSIRVGIKKEQPKNSESKRNQAQKSGSSSSLITLTTKSPFLPSFLLSNSQYGLRCLALVLAHFLRHPFPFPSKKKEQQLDYTSSTMNKKQVYMREGERDREVGLDIKEIRGIRNFNI